MRWTPPQSLIPFEHNWGRPEVRWDAIAEGIRKHGIRNAAQTTVAPTGTIATVAGCEGYGCEPVFALAYFRHVNDNGKDLKLTYASPRFDEALKKLGLGEEKRQEIVEQVMREGTCQHINEIPQAVRDTFVVSGDISAEEHVRMQGALQAFVDNSLSNLLGRGQRVQGAAGALAARGDGPAASGPLSRERVGEEGVGVGRGSGGQPEIKKAGHWSGTRLRSTHGPLGGYGPWCGGDPIQARRPP